MLGWLNAREATRVGAALADDFVLQGADASALQNGRGAPAERVQKVLQRFLQRVDRETHALELNLFRRAKLANSFKWRLLEKGIDRQIADELTQALILRLTPSQGGERRPEQSSAAPARRGRSRERHAGLLAQGEEHLTRGAYAEAMQCYQELLSLDPRNALALTAMGVALASLGRYGEAESHFRRAIGISPSLAMAYFNLAGVLLSTGRYRESEMPLRRALKLKPAYLEARISLGLSLVLLGRLAEARECYEMALKVEPRNTQAVVGVGHIESLEGRFTAAESAFRRALEIDPRSSYACAALVGLRRMTPADRAWLERAEQIVAGGLQALDECTLRFAMGKYCDDVGDFARAFRNYERANTLQRARVPPYDAAERARLVDDLQKAYTPEALVQPRDGASESERPVFVVGMPRSGTSLVAQILGSHPSAHAAGELEFWAAAVGKHEKVIRPGVPGESLRRKLASGYLQVLTAQSPSALRVIDKAPLNSDYLGLIHCIFPRARIIYLRRNPIDTCLSCYFQQLPPALSCATDLSDLAHYYREHRRLGAHWRRALPPEMLLEVPYEQLVADQEKWTRRILEFIGLPWNDRCLDFHLTQSTVLTASYWQVRQTMYQNSIGRWHNYRKFIGPLLELSDADS
jgi:tetratricopeptide (TPR) repeat protein